MREIFFSENLPRDRKASRFTPARNLQFTVSHIRCGEHPPSFVVWEYRNAKPLPALPSCTVVQTFRSHPQNYIPLPPLPANDLEYQE